MAIRGQAKPQLQRITQLQTVGLTPQNIPDDQAIDKLLGEADLDWFWTLASDSSDRKKVEQLM